MLKSLYSKLFCLLTNIFLTCQIMWKSKLIFRFILSVAAIATSVQLSSASNYAVAESVSSDGIVESGEQNNTSEVVIPAIAGISIGVITGLLISGLWYQKYRYRKLHSTAKIDRFREEFLCGSLADYYLSKSQAKASPANSRKSLTTPTKEEIPDFTTSEESSVTSSSTSETDNLVPKSTPDAVSNSLSDSYQKLIDEIVTTALKGQIASKDYISRQLVENVISGNGEIFERCLSDRLNSTKSELNKVKITPSLFQKETPELKKARLNLTLKALQSIQGEWEGVQKQKGNQITVTAAVQQIITASETSRLSILLEIIDPKENQEQITAVEWRDVADLLTILRSKLGDEAVQQLMVNYQTNIMKFIGMDGYDYLPQLLEEYERSH
jgi:hypothetical protein